MRMIGSVLIALMFMVIGGEMHITINKVISVSKEITQKLAPGIHYIAEEISNRTK